MYETITSCRSCGHGRLRSLISFGRAPIADRLLTEDDLSIPDPLIPLDLAFCPRCSLVQIRETVDPEILFCRDYPYFSSVSRSLLEHSRRNALELIESRKLGPGSLVMEPASNDGYMLRNFVERGIPVLGIDPARPALEAAKAGIPTLTEFFTRDLAHRLRREGKLADLLIANNVLAHVRDLNGFVEGIGTVLKPDGMAVIEVPYLLDLVAKNEFDTIYHQHLCYFSVTALDALFRRHSLYLNDVRRLDIHGGSLRLYIQPVESVEDSVADLLSRESELGIAGIDYYRDFVERVEAVRAGLPRLLGDLKSRGNRIAAYAAAAKGTALLSYCGIGTDMIDYAVDLNAFKQGKYMPGSRIPIADPSRLLEDLPEYTLLLAWNFADEILKQEEEYQRRGGRFIIPIPKPRIVDWVAPGQRSQPA